MTENGNAIPKPAPGARDVANVVCLGCGCLCDDLTIRIEDGQVVSLSPDCALGLSWFRVMTAPPQTPAASIDGHEVFPVEAIAEAARRLSTARSPLVLGLTGTTIEAQREAVTIADSIGAMVELAHATDAEPMIAAFQNVGAVGATLGEVKNRADVIVYWNVDPRATHPRHEERYAVDPIGRFVPEGRAGRYVIVVADVGVEIQTPADEVIRVPASAQALALRILDGLVRGIALEATEVEARCGVSPKVLEALASRLKSARYGAFFYGASLGRYGGAASVDAAHRLVCDLNEETRFVAVPLGGPGNPTGAEAVLTWQTGFPLAVDLGSDAPRFRPGEALAESRLVNGYCDAVLLVGWGATEGLSAEAKAALSRLSVVEVAPGATRGVALDAAAPGIEAGGTVMRCDGVTLPLRPVLESDRPDEATILRRLREAIVARRATR